MSPSWTMPCRTAPDRRRVGRAAAGANAYRAVPVIYDIGIACIHVNRWQHVDVARFPMEVVGRVPVANISRERAAGVLVALRRSRDRHALTDRDGMTGVAENIPLLKPVNRRPT